MTQLLPLSVHYIPFDREDLLLTSHLKETFNIIILLISCSYLCSVHIQQFPVYYLKLFKNTCNLQLKCHLDNDSLVKSELSLKSSIETNTVSIRKNNELEQSGLNLVSRLEMNAISIVENKLRTCKILI